MYTVKYIAIKVFFCCGEILLIWGMFKLVNPIVQCIYKLFTYGKQNLSKEKGVKSDFKAQKSNKFVRVRGGFVIKNDVICFSGSIERTKYHLESSLSQI